MALGINLDLQGVAKRTYTNLYYESSFMFFLNREYMEVMRQTGTPIIEVPIAQSNGVHKRAQAEILSQLTNRLAGFSSKKVDLTELALDYSFRIPATITRSNIVGALDSVIREQDSDNAFAIDQYGYAKFNTVINGASDGSQAYTNGQCVVWTPANKDAYIELLNQLKAKLSNRKVKTGYVLGLGATEYASLVSALTTVLHYETDAGVEGVSRGEIQSAYGWMFIEINDNALLNESGSAQNVKGYAGSQVASVGDTFLSAISEFDGNYPGFPGYYCIEGNLTFGADVVRPEALIKLVGSVPSINTGAGKGTFDDGQVGEVYSQTTAFNGTNIAKFVAVGLPTGLSINATTGEVTGTPTTAGEFAVSVYGEDTYGNKTAIQAGTITIETATN